MTQYNTLNVKLSNLQLNKLKVGIKNGTDVTLKISLDDVGDIHDENNFPHKFLLTNTQVSKLRTVFANNYWANIKISETQLHKIGPSGVFLCKLLGPLLKTWLPLIGNVLKPLAKRFLIPLGLTAGASATDTAIYKKIFGSCNMTLIISNEEMNDIMKIINSLEESGLMIKSVSKKNKKWSKRTKRRNSWNVNRHGRC